MTCWKNYWAEHVASSFIKLQIRLPNRPHREIRRLGMPSSLYGSHFHTTSSDSAYTSNQQQQCQNCSVMVSWDKCQHGRMPTTRNWICSGRTDPTSLSKHLPPIVCLKILSVWETGECYFGCFAGSGLFGSIKNGGWPRISENSIISDPQWDRGGGVSPGTK